ncbi:YfhO family protein, partial [Clostridium sp. AM58-1XD]|uniref:YfhO family protein n=1 Tax=Clostridium sp. AM58-1XD TaxID=2292307 RepID=UPI001FA9315D
MFIYFAIAIKLGFCGLFQALFLYSRFINLKKPYVFLLSICYALSFYNLHQMDNLMWLDGVYMLPLVMLGVWKSIEQKKHTLLIASVCCAILFNWYTAYMICLFSGIYFIYEVLIKKLSWGQRIYNLGIFVRNMLLGVFISFAFFLPVIYTLRQGKGGIEHGIFRIKYNGDFTHLLRGFVAGNDIGDNNLSLFCGTLVLVFIMYYFVLLIYEKRCKRFIISAVFLIIMLMSIIFKPLENIWNGFRIAESYFCRFSFLQTWVLIYFAAEGVKAYKKTRYNILSLCSLILVGCFAYLNFCERFSNQRGYWITITTVITTLLIFGIEKYLIKIKYLKVVTFSVLGVVILLELTIGGVAIGKAFYWDEAERYKIYAKNQESQLASIKDDTIFYRIEQTFNREKNLTKCTAYFNENLAYNYRGFSQYTSTFNENLRKLGEAFGYGINGVITMYDEPILPSDSLLGIKYILANQEFGGLVKKSDNIINNKNIYENPYALPLGFKVAESCSN